MRLLGGCLLLLSMTATAQQKVERIHIRVLNGHSGKPVAHAVTHTTILPVLPYRYPVNIRADANGVASLLLPTDTEVSSEVARHPVCQHAQKAAAQRYATFSVASILEQGVLAPDTCGHPAVKPNPGELILFVRPLHWWERLSY